MEPTVVGRVEQGGSTSRLHLWSKIWDKSREEADPGPRPAQCVVLCIDERRWTLSFCGKPISGYNALLHHALIEISHSQ